MNNPNPINLEVDLQDRENPMFYIDGELKEPKMRQGGRHRSYRVLVCGGREFDDSILMSAVLDNINIAVLIHGAARGADIMSAFIYGANFTNQDGVMVDPGRIRSYPADWDANPKTAGFIRNQQMLDEEDPDIVLAFPGGNGTDDMVSRALRHGTPVYRISRKEPQ